MQGLRPRRTKAGAIAGAEAEATAVEAAEAVEALQKNNRSG